MWPFLRGGRTVWTGNPSIMLQSASGRGNHSTPQPHEDLEAVKRALREGGLNWTGLGDEYGGHSGSAEPASTL